MFYLRVNQCKKAIVEFESILSQNPSFTIVITPLITAFRKCGETEKAKQLIDKPSTGTIRSQDPLLTEMYEFGNPAFLLKPKLIKLIENKKFNLALNVAQELLSIQPNDENTWINLGVIHTHYQSYTKAVEAFEKAYLINNKNELTIKNLIKVQWNMDKSQANKWIDKLLNLNPKHISALRVKGDYLSEIHRNKEAITYYHKALEVFPEDTLTLKKITKLLIKEGRYNEAIENLEVAFKHKNNNTNIAGLLARTLLVSDHSNSNNKKRALRIANRIYDIKPNYSNKFTLLMALRANKMHQKAEGIYKEMITIPLSESQLTIQEQLKALDSPSFSINSFNTTWIW